MPVSLGRALVGLAPLTNKTANPVFRGDVVLEDGRRRRGFIKDLDARQLANELLVACLGHRLNLPMPEAALVVVSKSVSSKFTKIPHSNGKDFIAFCSIDAGGTTVAQILSSLGQAKTLTALKRAPEMGWMYGFDTWIANVDRHMNNLLVTGSGSIRLIDHGHCFSGPSWTKRDLKADAEYRNKLSNWLTPQLTEAERKGAMADVTNLVGKIVSTDVEAAMREAMAQQYYGEDDADALIGFLESRGAVVSAMSAKALGTLL